VAFGESLDLGFGCLTLGLGFGLPDATLWVVFGCAPEAFFVVRAAGASVVPAACSGLSLART